MIGESSGPRRRGGSSLTKSLPSAIRFDALTLAGVLAVAMVAWSLATLYTDRLRWVIYAPKLQVGVEAAAVSALLFGALILSMFVTERSGDRLLWVAGGLLVAGLGGLTFEYAGVAAGDALDPDAATYESLLVWTAAAALFAVGLVPKRPPRLRKRLVLIILLALGAAGLALGGVAHLLPPLVLDANPASAVVAGQPPYEATAWNNALATGPLLLGAAASLGAVSLYRRGSLGGWLVVAMVLLAGSQLRSVFQPPAFSPVLTVADGLHLAFAAVVALGGVLKLRRIAAERESLLATEKEANRRLGELSVMKADFTSMVAHELNSPLAAIRTLSDMLALDGLDHATRRQALETILSETDALNALVADVRAAGAVERDDFAVELRPVPLNTLLTDTAARALPGDHPLTIKLGAAGDGEIPDRVWADPERVGQVLRNLLSNAAKYSPDGAPVELRAAAAKVPGRVRVEVADGGMGIHPDDLSRVFEKFGRGRDATGRKVPGVGLGLYLSRRIVRCHGSELTASSAPGKGSVFGFELEAVR